MKPYRWRCHLCRSANAAEAKSCAHCGFPAQATGKQIEAASADTAPAPPEQQPDWRALPLRHQVLVGLGALALCSGLILAKFAHPIALNLLGLGIVCALLVAAHFWLKRP